jgi:hypothetical protein
MARLLVFLPVCLLLQDQRCACTMLEADEKPGPARRVNIEDLPLSQRPQAVERLLREDVPRFLQMCVDRYDREVQGYRCTLQKRERVRGKLLPAETVDVHFREKPFSVYMDWKKGAGKAQKTLFVEGENQNRMLARPAGLFSFVGVVARDVNSPEIKAAGRYTITEFGMKLGTLRTLKPMSEARKRNALHVAYHGIFQVPETGDRRCYKLVRTPYDPPEDEGVNELTIYIDLETWLQVGSVLKDSAGQLIAEYYFRNILINPTFAPKQFSREAL